MTQAASKRFSTGRSLAQLASFSALWIIFQSNAYASCGDYLLHGPDRANSHGSMASQLPADLVSHSLPAGSPEAPRSACEGGKCQSAPLAFPVDPPRISVPKQPATLIGAAELRSTPDDGNWARPMDGLLPSSPFLEIASPPPRLS